MSKKSTVGLRYARLLRPERPGKNFESQVLNIDGEIELPATGPAYRADSLPRSWSVAASQRLKELGLFPIDQGRELAGFIARHEISVYDKLKFVVSATDPHPSATHHLLIAETFFNSMVESGLIEKLLQ